MTRISDQALDITTHSVLEPSEIERALNIIKVKKRRFIRLGEIEISWDNFFKKYSYVENDDVKYISRKEAMNMILDNGTFDLAIPNKRAQSEIAVSRYFANRIHDFDLG
ncbi:hypothetical protein KKE60_07205 [Patescibacteria group bacterium]|nr:hypothetical protein [Patescibacteria group bacterium]